MTVTKALLYTFLAFTFWVLIQLIILLSIKYWLATPDDFTHIYGIVKILSVSGAFFLIYFFFWKPKFDFRKTTKFPKYNHKIYLYLPLLGLGLFLLNKPFWDAHKIWVFYQGNKAIDNPIKSINSVALTYTVISSVLIAPIIEELFYRKFLLDKLLKTNSAALSVMTSSLCFSIILLVTPNNLVPAFLGGIILGTIYLKTRRIGYCILLHFFINLIVIATNNMDHQNNWLTGYNFDIIYWLLVGTGIIMILFGIKRIIKVN